MCRKIFHRLLLTVSTRRDNQADHKKNRQHFCPRNQIRDDISCELSNGRRFMCNIKVYFLPEILKVYIFVMIGVFRGIISKQIKHFLTVAETSPSLHAR